MAIKTIITMITDVEGIKLYVYNDEGYVILNINDPDNSTDIDFQFESDNDIDTFIQLLTEAKNKL